MKAAGHKGKFVANKSLAKEDLPSRYSKATITGGDLYQRMGNYYGKSVTPGAQPGPSPLIAFTTIGRGIGMA